MFGDPGQLLKLNSIVWPAIPELLVQELNSHAHDELPEGSMLLFCQRVLDITMNSLPPCECDYTARTARVTIVTGAFRVGVFEAALLIEARMDAVMDEVRLFLDYRAPYI